MQTPEWSSLIGYIKADYFTTAVEHHEAYEKLRHETADARKAAEEAIAAANEAATAGRPVAEVTKLTSTARKATYTAWANECQMREILATLCKAVERDHTAWTVAAGKELVERFGQINAKIRELGFSDPLPHGFMMSHPDCQRIEKQCLRGGDGPWRQTARQNTELLKDARTQLAAAAAQL